MSARCLSNLFTWSDFGVAPMYEIVMNVLVVEIWPAMPCVPRSTRFWIMMTVVGFIFHWRNKKRDEKASGVLMGSAQYKGSYSV